MKQGIDGRQSSFEIASAVLKAMYVSGVAPIPRNYQLYYEAFIATNKALSEDLTRLGSRPTQSELDSLAAVYLGAGNAAIYEAIHEQVTEHLSEAAQLLEREQHVLHDYNQLLTDTVGQLSSVNQQTVGVLKSLVRTLSSATGATLSHNEKTRRSYSRSQAEFDEVYEQLERYKAAANTDSLTGLCNRRAFDEELAAIYAEAPELLRVTALVLADVDYFKRVNDRFGHPVGDRLLVSLAASLRKAAPSTASIGRVGGEEFALIIRERLRDEVHGFAQHLRSAIARQRFVVERLGIDLNGITMSIGVAMGSQASSADELYRAADNALYRAKNEGRNKVVMFDDRVSDEMRRDWLIYQK